MTPCRGGISRDSPDIDSSKSAATTHAGDHDGAARAGQLHRLCEGAGRVRGHVHHDVGECPGRLTEPRDRIVVADVHREVGSEHPRLLETARISSTEAGHHHERGARLPHRRDRREPANAGPEHGDDGARRGARDVDAPAQSGTDGVEQRGEDRVEVIRYGHHHAVGSEVLVLRVAAPQARRAVDRDEAVHVAQPVARTSPVLAAFACLALPARLEHLDRDAVAFADAPPPCRPRSDPLEHTDGLVAGDEREPAEQHARVLLVVRPAQTTRLDAQERVVITDVRQREVSFDQLARALEHQRAGHALTPRTWRAARA